VGIESKKFSEEENHLGIDISAQAGNPVFASGAGNVVFAGQKNELGNTIIIDHQNGYRSSYSHLKTINVRKGYTVSKGDIIGTVGSTGNTSGAHLHFEITKDGINLDPSDFIE
ncbi:MAG: M23 family metallopeptidase, partial [Fibrobacter sp.]|nr:M23 family metallopeptidase [Fibrobacter sp.]